MGIKKVLIGVLGCLITVAMVILIVTLGFSLDKVGILGIDNLVQAIFILAPHSYSFMTTGMWSIIAALTTGAFIGGLLVKNIKSGIAIGILSFVIIIVLQFAVGFLFNFTTFQAWYALEVPSHGGDIIIDFLLSVGILIGAGAIGGAITREDEAITSEGEVSTSE